MEDDLDYLIAKFDTHAKEFDEDLKKKGRIKKTDVFSLPKALATICREIKKIKEAI